MFYADAVVLEDETVIDQIFHPLFPEQHSSLRNRTFELLLKKYMEDGRQVCKPASAHDASAYARQQLTCFSAEHKRFEFPHTYKVGISPRLLELRTKISDELQHHLDSTP